MKALIVILTISLFVSSAQAQYGGGTGEPNNPYLIYTSGQMNAIGTEPNDWDKQFKLMADIDLAGFSYDRAVIAPDMDPDKSGFQEPSFTGVFDGNGYSISHLTIAGGGYLGLFGQLAFGAEVKDIEVMNVNITGSDNYVGSLVGYNEGIVTKCYSTGMVSGDYCIAGLVGTNNGTVTQCHCSCKVNGRFYVGGLVASNRGYVSFCCSNGEVNGDQYGYVGGLVGGNYGTVTQCYSTSSVSGGLTVGGLVGDNDGDLTHCYSTGAVSGVRCVGGLTGFFIIEGADNLGDVDGCFWDTRSSGRYTSDGGTGLVTSQMQDVQTYLDARWDFAGEIKDGLHEIWRMPQEAGYPVLAVLSGYTPPQLQGLGTPEDPYLISDALDLGAMVYYSPYAHYRLVASIDLSGIRWGTAVIPWFGGTFDGNGHKISNLMLEGGGYLGLFGRLKSGAEVKNLGAIDVRITGSGDYVGGLVGHNSDSHILNCYINGKISGNEQIGGLVGYNDGGSVLNCYSNGGVDGSSSVGGLVGYNNDGVLTNCYSNSEVSGNELVGGLVGTNYGEYCAVTTCYSTGEVSGNEYVGGLVGNGDPVRVKNSVWDVETSGLTGSSGGGISLTTADMMDPEILRLNGFGGVPNWVLDSRRDYPRLFWEGTPGQMIPEPVIDWLDGSGTPEDPFQIENADQLLLIHKSSMLWDKSFVLIVDIDVDPNLSGSGVFRWAVIPTFEGSFIGNGHVILNLKIEGGDHLGLFGKLIEGSVVRDIGLENVSVHGTGQYIGGLVGYNSGSYVLNCYMSGEVSGNELLGGLVGYNEGVVTECFSTGTVSGTGEGIGGLVGINDGAVTYCFWDTQTSGQTTSAGGTGKTTAEMQTASTFLDAGWDFVDETTNGTDDIWWILEGQDYPRLRELPEGLWLRPLPAFSPTPQDGAIVFTQSPILHWAPAELNVQHDVYFGEGKKAVVNATTLSLGIYRGRQPGEVTTYDPGILERGKTYYWRIDEYNTDTLINKGHVWSFTRAKFILVDDFESYDAGDNQIWRSWHDGLGYGVPVAPPDFFPGNGTGSVVGEIGWTEETIVHSGNQAMPYEYYNNKQGYFKYSEATLTLSYPRDWTEVGVGILSLWFYGDSSNAPEPMYVAVANADSPTAVVYHDNPNAVQIKAWTEWIIDLQEFDDQGVNLTDVDTISIGFGDRNNPQPGGSGRMYFDDIRLYRPRPETSYN